MKPKPKIDHFLDSDEQALISAIGSESYQPGHSVLDGQRLELLQAAARATINDQRRSTISGDVFHRQNFQFAHAAGHLHFYYVVGRFTD